MSLLTKLRAHSEIVPETAQPAAVRALGVKHVSLSASRITAAAQMPEHASIVDDAVDWAQEQAGKGGNRKLAGIQAVERLSVEFAQAMAAVVEGTVAIEVDGRLAYKRRPTINRARSLVAQLEALKVDKSRLLLKIPATWEGIEAAAKLEEKDGIHCCMTLVFGMHQLAACADAGAKVISPAVGRITDWHMKNDGVEDYPPENDPGVKLAMTMHDYLVRHSYASMLMPGMFRSLEQAAALAGCEMLALPSKLVDLLDHTDHAVEKRVTREGAAERAPEKITVDAAQFTAMNSADPVSASKLQGGVQNLSWAVVSQEKQLVDWIMARQDKAAESSTATLFRIWDYDNDGYIDREEWSGSEEVFNALDRDNNGRISLEEMAIGLGAPYKPSDE